VVEIARCERGHAVGELDRTRVGVAPDREVRELTRLFGTGFGELGTTVTDLRSEQAGKTVEVAAAALVVHPRSFAAHDHRHVGLRIRRHAREVHPQVFVRFALRHQVPQV
jgi:hypothetical protein